MAFIMTYEIACACAWEAGHTRMRMQGRECWDDDDYAMAVETFNRLWTDELKEQCVQEFLLHADTNTDLIEAKSDRDSAVTEMYAVMEDHKRLVQANETLRAEVEHATAQFKRIRSILGRRICWNHDCASCRAVDIAMSWITSHD